MTDTQRTFSHAGRLPAQLSLFDPSQKKASHKRQAYQAGINPHAELTVLSYGGGQDSTAILYKIIHDPAFKSHYVPGKLLVVRAPGMNTCIPISMWPM